MNTIWISELDEIHLKNGGCSRTAAAYLIVRSAEMELQLVSIVSYSRPSLMIIALWTQFHVYLLLGLFSIVP